MNKTNLIYFDNNGTTQTHPDVIKAISDWMSSGISNPSTDNFLSKPSKTMIDIGISYILKHCGVSEKDYKVIFTSSGSESNSFVLRSVVSSYKNK